MALLLFIPTYCSDVVRKFFLYPAVRGDDIWSYLKGGYLRARIWFTTQPIGVFRVFQEISVFDRGCFDRVEFEDREPFGPPFDPFRG